MADLNTFFDVSTSCSYWLSEFSGKLENYSDPEGKTKGLDYYLRLKDLIFQKFHCHYQIFQKEWIISNQHIYLVLAHVAQAFNSKSNISKNKDMEFLLYIAIQKQINRSIKLVGVNFTKNRTDALDFAQIVFGLKENVKKAVEFLLNLNIQTIQAFNFNKSINFTDIIEKYNINEQLIKNQLIFNPQSSYLKHDGEKIGSLPEEERNSVLLEAINQKMIQLFLENYKKSR
jgi:tRNA threonylcarbamoyladenosine modification (KEOPS) complex Cgi121 subunit